MPKIHFLNVNQGDCIILEHDSGRKTVFDISAGNIERESALFEALLKQAIIPAKGNFRMCQHPTNPLDYLTKLGAKEIWRFILSHPDMDHLDGFNALLDEFDLLHFWHSGAKKEKPDFSGNGGFKEEDWDRYAKVIADDEPGTKLLHVQAGAQFMYANKDDTPNGMGDHLYILAPNKALIDKGNATQDFNDASYVILYNSPIGKVLLAGDAHDATWDYVKEHHKQAASNVTLLVAPHHGRKSGRSYEFLDFVNPKLTLFGCAPSEHLAYDAWNYRNLTHITNNQCGCIVAEGKNSMEIYVENEVFTSKSGGNTQHTNQQGFYFLGTVK